MELYQAAHLAQGALIEAALVSMIPLGASVAVGLLVSVLQAATQVQEQSAVYLAKICTLAAVAYWLGPWLALHLNDYSASAFDEITALSR